MRTGSSYDGDGTSSSDAARSTARKPERTSCRPELAGRRSARPEHKPPECTEPGKPERTEPGRRERSTRERKARTGSSSGDNGRPGPGRRPGRSRAARSRSRCRRCRSDSFVKPPQTGTVALRDSYSCRQFPYVSPLLTAVSRKDVPTQVHCQLTPSEPFFSSLPCSSFEV